MVFKTKAIVMEMIEAPEREQVLRWRAGSAIGRHCTDNEHTQSESFRFLGLTEAIPDRVLETESSGQC